MGRETILKHTEAEGEEQPSFAKLGLRPETLAAVKKFHWTVPTTVQQQVIPLVLAEKNIVAVAPTGTGKTGAYALPLHTLFLNQKPTLEPAQPWAVVLVPTRELAAQTARVIRSIFRPHGDLVVEIVGGVGFSYQNQQLSRRTAVLVATPGRCEDLVQREGLSLSAVHYWVLDEMDRMLDYGFRGVVRRLIKRTPPEHQTHLLLLSATKGCAEEMIRELGIKRPECVDISYQNHVPPNLEEGVYLVGRRQKLQMLEAMLQTWSPRRTLVFLSRKEEVDEVTNQLQKNGVSAVALHADFSMRARRQSLERFTSAKNSVLVATDLAGRGLDVRGVELVVHLSVPKTAEEYIHRSGRTARAGASGRAVLIVTRQQRNELECLERKLGRRLPRRRLPGFNYGRISAGMHRIRVSLTGRALRK